MKNEKRKILIAGGTGLVGTILREYFEEKGTEVYILTRKEKNKSRYLQWDPAQQVIDPRIRNFHFDTIINATGAGIADKRWTLKRKKILRDSRILPIEFLWKLIKEKQLHTQDFISISAVGIYGNRKNPVTELDTPAKEDDFLSRLCKEWESAFMENALPGITTSLLRLGVVISHKGGFIKPFLFPIRTMAAPYFGTGTNYISWIHESDLARATWSVIVTPSENRKHMYNLTTPVPITSAEFSRSMKKIFNPWAIRFPVPGWTLNLIFGEMKTAILADAQVMPFHLEKMNYHFLAPAMQEALLLTKSEM